MVYLLLCDSFISSHVRWLFCHVILSDESFFLCESLDDSFIVMCFFQIINFLLCDSFKWFIYFMWVSPHGLFIILLYVHLILSDDSLLFMWFSQAIHFFKLSFHMKWKFSHGLFNLYDSFRFFVMWVIPMILFCHVIISNSFIVVWFFYNDLFTFMWYFPHGSFMFMWLFLMIHYFSCDSYI